MRNKAMSEMKMKRLLVGAVMCMACAWPGRAMTQDLYTTTSTTTSGMITTILLVWIMLPEDKARKSVTHYMNENKALLSETLITGQGQAIEDLASMSGVPSAHHARFATAFAEAIEPHRDTLVTTERYTDEHAGLLLDALRQSLEHDQILHDAAQETMRHM